MNALRSGFTLIEIMVVVAIVSIISAVVVFNYRLFSDRLAVSAAVQEVAIAMRQAQVYGLSVRGFGGSFSGAYGLYFSQNDPTAYYLFVDKNGDGLYEGDQSCSVASECIERHVLSNNIFIPSLCGFTPTSGVCPPAGATGVAITFKRPSPDARVSFVSGSGYAIPGYTAAKIYFRSASGNAQSSVSINQTGEIATDN